MLANSLQDYCETAKKLAIQAGQAIMAYYSNPSVSLKHKVDHSPVTAADMAAHGIITDGLEKAYKLPIVSEEGIPIDDTIRSQWHEYWLIDPLDGTREFLRGNGEFSVNIALIRGQQAIVGIVFSPVHQTLYWGIAGQGAYQQTASHISPLITRRANVNKLTFALSHSHTHQHLSRLTKQWPNADFIQMGSSLKICLIAAGQADIYPRLGTTTEWDTAASHCILTAAGGKIIDVSGQELRYNKQESLLNPWFLAVGDTTIDWLALLSDEFKRLPKE